MNWTVKVYIQPYQDKLNVSMQYHIQLFTPLRTSLLQDVGPGFWWAWLALGIVWWCPSLSGLSVWQRVSSRSKVLQDYCLKILLYFSSGNALSYRCSLKAKGLRLLFLTNGLWLLTGLPGLLRLIPSVVLVGLERVLSLLGVLYLPYSDRDRGV